MEESTQNAQTVGSNGDPHSIPSNSARSRGGFDFVSSPLNVCPININVMIQSLHIRSSISGKKLISVHGKKEKLIATMLGTMVPSIAAK